MFKFRKYLIREVSKHRKIQMVITFGVVASSVVAYLDPAYQQLGIAMGVGTNMLWIWEDMIG